MRLPPVPRSFRLFALTSFLTNPAMFNRKSLALVCCGCLLLGLAAVAYHGAQPSTAVAPFAVDVAAPFSQALAVVGPLLTSPGASSGFLPTGAGSSSGSVAELESRAQQLEEAGKYHSASLEFFRAGDKALAAGNEGEHARLMGEHGRVLLKVGDLKGAKWALDLADQRLQATGQAAARAGVLLLRGNEAKSAGRYAEATALIHQALTAFEKVRDPAGVARAHAADCDLLQLQRLLEPASAACARALAMQPAGHPDRPETERISGLVAFFGSDMQRAVALHMSAYKGFRAQRRELEASWLREFIIDDQAAILENAAQGHKDVYTPLINELVQLALRLESASEVVWWRVSDARLRLADLQRKQGLFADAEESLRRALRAFQSRPAGYELVPDYATLYEFEGLLARDRGDLHGAQEALSKCKAILEPIVGPDNLDVHMLEQEIQALGVAIEA